METLKIWETKLSEDFIYPSNLEELKKSLTDNTLKFMVKEKFTPGKDIESFIEQIATNSNVEIVYTDTKHPFAVSKNDMQSETIIDPTYFQEHKEEIIEIFQNALMEQTYITITPQVYSDEFIIRLLEAGKKNIFFLDIKPSDEIIKRIQNELITSNYRLNGENIKISSENLIGYYKKKDLENDKNIKIDEPLTEEQIEFLKFRKQDELTTFELCKFNSDFDFNKAQKIIKNAIEVNKRYPYLKLEIKAHKRKQLKPFLESLKNNIKGNLQISMDNEIKYSFDEYLEEDKKLDKMVEDINNSSLSPFEKYMAVYNIVKKFKKYKENEENLQESRYLKYTLNNDYMVCVGYAKLLIELLTRIGIDSVEYSTTVYGIENQDTDKEKTKFTNFGGHARVLVNLEDPKYGINGYYISDPTWDNHLMKNDLWNYAIQPMDSMQVNLSSFTLKDIDFYLDIHSIEEYQEKVEKLFDIKFRKEEAYDKEKEERIPSLKAKTIKEKDKKYNELRLKVFNKMTGEIIATLRNLDPDKYQEIKQMELKTEQDYIKLISELGPYFVEKSNKRIPNETIIEAASKGKFLNSNDTEAFKEEYKDKMLKIMEVRESAIFPLLKEQFATSTGYQSDEDDAKSR